MTLAEEFKSRNFSKFPHSAIPYLNLLTVLVFLGIYGQWLVYRVAS